MTSFLSAPDELWWSQITGPQSLVEGAVNALMDGKNVLLSLPTDMPWRSTFRARAEADFRLRSRLGDLVVEIIDVRDECPRERNVEQYLLHRFASREVANGYRPQTGMTLSQYLIQQEVLANRLLWIKGLTEETWDPWIKFFRSFSHAGIENGLLVMECGKEDEAPSKRLAVLTYREFVSAHDLRLFNNILLGAPQYRSYPDLWKQYLVTLCAELCADTFDAEVSYALLDAVDLQTTSPLEVLAKIADDPCFSRRGEDPQHVLYRLRKNQLELLERHIWSAQIQIAFPHIEILRVNLIQQHREGLVKFLSEETFLQGPYGKQVHITDPMDLEVGSLWRIAHQEETLGFSLDEKETLGFLRDMRNALAHLDCSTPGDLNRLFCLPE